MHVVAAWFLLERRGVKDVFPGEPWVGYSYPPRFEAVQTAGVIEASEVSRGGG